MLARVRNAAAKLVWGVRVVGPARTAVGLARLAVLRVRRSPEVVVPLRSGPVLGFTYPSQLVPALVVFGDYIDPEIPFLREVARPDWVVLDVGAAIGQFSVLAAILPVAHVHAFEPSGDNIAALEANLARNRVAERVTVHQVALSDSETETVFATSANPFLSRLDRPGGSGSHGETVPVRTLTGTVDGLGVERVGCLKVNVAGFEAAVLAGAEDLLRRQAADVLVILISEGAAAWFPRIAALGYRFFFFHPGTRTLHELERLDDVPGHGRPWPARHLIGVSGPAVARGVLGDLAIVPAAS